MCFANPLGCRLGLPAGGHCLTSLRRRLDNESKVEGLVWEKEKVATSSPELSEGLSDHTPLTEPSRLKGLAETRPHLYRGGAAQTILFYC
jgi:hypothetical protein